MTAVSPQDPWSQVSLVVELVRSGGAQTRPELAEATGLGRNVVALRLQAAQSLGLVETAGVGRSRGGRAADVWQFRAGVGHVLVVLMGVRQFRVALADLAGEVLDSRVAEWPVEQGPEATCERVASELESMLGEHPDVSVWGVSLGVPYPVDIRDGSSVDPVAPTSTVYRFPRDFDARGWFSRRFQRPVWVDAVSNLMALGAASASGAPDDLVFIRLGTGLGAGIVSNGRVHRGAAWVAGELNHVTVSNEPDRICLCGRIGCLDTYSSGWAMVTDAKRALAEGRSPYLASLAGQVSLDDVAAGARFGDPTCVEIVVRAGDHMGRAIASMVTWFNPAEVVIGGFAMAQSELFRSVVERAIRAHALAACVDGLVVRAGDPGQNESVAGAVELAVRTLLSPGYLVEWGPQGSPAAAPGLAARRQQF